MTIETTNFLKRGNKDDKIKFLNRPESDIPLAHSSNIYAARRNIRTLILTDLFDYEAVSVKSVSFCTESYSFYLPKSKEVAISIKITIRSIGLSHSPLIRNPKTLKDYNQLIQLVGDQVPCKFGSILIDTLKASVPLSLPELVFDVEHGDKEYYFAVEHRKSQFAIEINLNANALK